MCVGDLETCTVYEATMDIVYDTTGKDNTDTNEVTDTVTAIAKEHLNGEDIKNKVNNWADHDGGHDEMMVTNIAYGLPEEDMSGGQEASYKQEQGLSKGEKAAIFVVASILLLLLLILFCLWRRHLHRRKEEEAMANKSVATQDTAAVAPGRGSDGDDSSYKTSDFNNLGLHHSKLDVHWCTSGTCELCNPIQGHLLPGVSFVSSKSE